jgi:hypothetical protein
MGNTTQNQGSNRPGNQQAPSSNQDAQKKEVRTSDSLADTQRQQRDTSTDSASESDREG